MEWSEELFSGLLRAAPDAIVVMATDGRILLVNDQAEQKFGYSSAQLVGRSATMLLPASGDYPEQLSGREDNAVIDSVPVTVRRQDGTELPVEASLSVVASSQGRLLVAVLRDVSERLRTQQEQVRLRAVAEQQRIEVREHRTQRLESLGQLAGGIAHDFNNMLGVIVNYAGFVIEEAEGPQPDSAMIASDAKQIVRAGERGTELTHQLLAFARREVVRPRVLDLNEVLADIGPSLRRVLGDRVVLDVQSAPGLPLISADPGQLEQLLTNLASNANDAMPSGGRVVIETARCGLPDGDRTGLPAGEYVCLRVRDGGVGMPPDVVERAFEPFFTTKADGDVNGLGLGLATVHGIAAQAGGHVSILSEQGVGSTVTVLLPATTERPAVPSSTPGPDTVLGQGETLLVVEDEAPLREVAGRILSGAGYRVLSADGGAAALALASQYEGGIDLLVSDVIMPGMLGKEVAERLQAERPETRVLFMSGYAHPVLASQGTLDAGVELLEKPFTATDLLRAVRHRLDAVLDRT